MMEELDAVEQRNSEGICYIFVFRLIARNEGPILRSQRGTVK